MSQPDTQKVGLGSGLLDVTSVAVAAVPTLLVFEGE